jgi:sporulation protein YlmC with PRC-barrel domain
MNASNGIGSKTGVNSPGTFRVGSPDRNRSRSGGIHRVLPLVTVVGMLGVASIIATPTLSQVVALVKVDVNVVAKGYRVSKLIGSSVSNEKKEKIGSLDDIIIDHDNSRLLYAVLQVGGFLGLGGHLVAVPYDNLRFDDESRTIELPGATKDSLKNLNEFKYRS